MISNRGGVRYPKWRRCETCGYVSYRKHTSHKVWVEGEGRSRYCGYMRVCKDESGKES